VLAASKTGQIDTFDPTIATARREGDVSVEQLGKAAKLPWETDGRRWHLQDRIAHNGKPCHWDGRALEFVIDLLEKNPAFAPANWNDRSTVEVRTAKSLGWFLHARTAAEWLLTLCFRVRRDQFNTEDLDAELGLPPLDEMQEIPAYGREPRVKARNLKSAWQEVTIRIWNRAEVDTPAFRSFLQQASQSFVALGTAESANPEDLMPWKKLGRKWHLLRKGLPGNGRIPWNFDLLAELLPVLEANLGDLQPDYAIRTKINWSNPRTGRLAVELHTKRTEGAELCLYGVPGEISLGRISTFGSQRSITPAEGCDEIRIRLTQTEHATDPQLAGFLAESVPLLGRS
jgi:excinuclease ABC subunit A